MGAGGRNDFGYGRVQSFSYGRGMNSGDLMYNVMMTVNDTVLTFKNLVISDFF